MAGDNVCSGGKGCNPLLAFRLVFRMFFNLFPLVRNATTVDLLSKPVFSTDLSFKVFCMRKPKKKNVWFILVLEMIYCTFTAALFSKIAFENLI